MLVTVLNCSPRSYPLRSSDVYKSCFDIELCGSPETILGYFIFGLIIDISIASGWYTRPVSMISFSKHTSKRPLPHCMSEYNSNVPDGNFN